MDSFVKHGRLVAALFFEVRHFRGSIQTEVGLDARNRIVKILVVDDDPAICNMLRIILSAKGHQVDTYLDPTATPIIKDWKCNCPAGPHCADAMLVDYFMPNMNGLEFLKLLEERGCGAVKGNKAIITAYGTNELRQELAQLGVKYFKKPFKLPEISQWLEDCSTRVAQAGGTLS